MNDMRLCEMDKEFRSERFETEECEMWIYLVLAKEVLG